MREETHLQRSLRILSLDVASSLGWAIFDTERGPSSIHCDAVDLVSLAGIKPGDEITGMAKRRLLRRKIDEVICKILADQRPSFVCIEQPLNFIGDENEKSGGKKARGQRSLPMHVNVPAAAPGGKKEKKGGPNANSAFLSNQLFAVADTVCWHKVEHVVEVSPRTWQTITKSMPGDTKERSIAFCKQMRITLPQTNKVAMADAADAACIAVWAQGHAQELKLLAMAQGNLI